jgi:hypothetical protein
MTPSARDALAQALAQSQANLSAAQFTAAALFFQALAEAAQTDRLDEMDINAFRKFLTLRRLLHPTITELVDVVLPPKGKPLFDRINEGLYINTNSDITADRFPITLDAGPRNLVLAHFRVKVENDEIDEWAKANGYKFALHEDLEAVGSHTHYSNLQREYPIIQLGSSTDVNGYKYVPVLGKDDDGRYLDLGLDWGIWSDNCRFLLVSTDTPSVT